MIEIGPNLAMVLRALAFGITIIVIFWIMTR